MTSDGSTTPAQDARADGKRFGVVEGDVALHKNLCQW
jgi:hypothetical protein